MRSATRRACRSRRTAGCCSRRSGDARPRPPTSSRPASGTPRPAAKDSASSTRAGRPRSSPTGSGGTRWRWWRRRRSPTKPPSSSSPTGHSPSWSRQPPGPGTASSRATPPSASPPPRARAAPTGAWAWRRAPALTSEGGAAEASYLEAIDRLRRTVLRPELGRAHLLYGEWLRREGRRVDAREQLRTAHEIFVAIRMEAFAGRARRELLATGESVRKRAPDMRDELTPQEEQIARLASDGLSNSEIGARLFLKPAHHRVASAQRVHQARDHLAQGASRGAARLRT